MRQITLKLTRKLVQNFAWFSGAKWPISTRIVAIGRFKSHFDVVDFMNLVQFWIRDLFWFSFLLANEWLWTSSKIVFVNKFYAHTAAFEFFK